jgi:PmbA protein
MSEITLRDTAEGALALMKARGFDGAQVTVYAERKDEVNIAHNEPSLLRSTDSLCLALIGIVDGRRATTQVTDLSGSALHEGVDALMAAARSAPRDDANQVSSGQHAHIVQGPQESDVALLTAKAQELLDFRGKEAPKVNIIEAHAAHTLVRSHTVTTGGSELEAQVGHHSLDLFGTAREGQRSSSFAVTGGTSHDLESRHAVEHFGIAEMLRALERSIETRPVGEAFLGDVVLAPEAVADFINWFLGQLCDVNLIAGSSLYRDRVGDTVGSPLLTLRSRFDGPGVTALSSDAFVAPPVEVLAHGVLKTLTPSFYGSLKTGLPHVPIVGGADALGRFAAVGWELAAGDTAREKMVSDTKRGALVGRLSMGRPASNGDFSGVIKNSFAIADGKQGTALSETMITGNVAQMLKDVVAVSRERIDTGAFLLPWVRIGNLHFS